MQEYNKIIIFGGYHDGEEYDVMKGLEHVALCELPHPSLPDDILTTMSSVNVHCYRKLDATFRKQYNRGEVVDSWLELDDLNIYIPVKTTQRQEESLKRILQRALKANYTPKYSERG